MGRTLERQKGRKGRKEEFPKILVVKRREGRCHVERSNKSINIIQGWSNAPRP